MNNIGENYVKLVLKVGELDSDYVDAYYGTKDWQPHDKLETPDDSTALRNICSTETDSLLNGLDALKDFKANEFETLRYRFLYKQLLAVKAKLFMLGGGTFSFDEESKALYDAVAPSYPKEHYQKIIDGLNNILPGKGDVLSRLEEFRKSFVVPKEKLDTVFKAAIAECKKKTLDHIQLPENENFKIEYVTGKPWSGYNWYEGNYFSKIQINTDLPIYIDRAIDLAAHEGYPGHHVYNCLLEEYLVKKNGWMEFTVYPLFSPQSLIAEGTANFGIQMIFPGDTRIEFEKKILFPLAGINPNKADKYYEVFKLTNELGYSGNEAARNYLDGKWNKAETIGWLMKYSLMSKERAEQRLKFIEKYRSYVINYNLGQDLIKNYIERNGGLTDHQAKRWELFNELLSTPQTPSGLK
ncbi:MAG: hypothetical protein ACYCVH_06575 [Ignavibacteriaceae bacterium]